MTYQEAVRRAADQLASAEIENGQADARFLMEWVSGMSLTSFLLHQIDTMPQEMEEKYFSLIDQRTAHVPLQHLTGEQEFMGLSFLVNEDVLIPRPETELLVEETLAWLGSQSPKRAVISLPEDDKEEHHDNRKSSVLDLCTGSGCIAVSLAHAMPALSVTGVDLSEKALKKAKENAKRNQADVTFLQSDLFAELGGRKFDLIVSNPPYIASAEIETLMPEVRDHEPRMALDGTEDGLYFYRRIIKEAKEHLNSCGALYFEIGYDQGDAVSELFREHGYQEIIIRKDYAGLDRVARAVWNGK